MLVSGVWRLWLTPRRKSSLAASSSRSWRFWASTGRTAGRCGSRRRSRSRTARAGPGRPAPSGGSRAGDRRARRGPRSPARRTARSGRDSPGTTLLLGDDRRVDRGRRWHRSARTPRGASVGRPVDEGLDVVARRDARRSRRGSGRARGCAARGRRPAGCGCRRGGRARRRRTTSIGRREVAGRHAVDRRGDRPERRDAGRPRAGSASEDRR